MSATLQQMETTLDSLRGTPTIPGLDIDSVVNKYVDVEFSEYLNSITDENEKREARSKFVQYYITGPGKQFIQNVIQSIKDTYQNVMDMLDDLRTSIVNITASNAVPAVVVAGSATGTPNPAYTIIDNTQKKKSVSAVMKSLVEFLKRLLESALLIHFELPDSVITFSQSINELNGLL